MLQYYFSLVKIFIKFEEFYVKTRFLITTLINVDRIPGEGHQPMVVEMSM